MQLEFVKNDIRDPPSNNTVAFRAYRIGVRHADEEHLHRHCVYSAGDDNELSFPPLTHAETPVAVQLIDSAAAVLSSRSATHETVPWQSEHPSCIPELPYMLM
jgi:hypothetical protein